jgi:Acetyltransferases, including N-acetylases of ribosomal proteins
MTQIAETERLVIREIDESDAAFMNALLNSPGFLNYIGDRGVRSDDDARRFISERYRKSYAENGYGLYAVLLKDDLVPVGMCGFVRRDTLPGPDLGFAFLPEFEGKGFGTESSIAVLNYGREKLGFDRVLAITTLDNRPSIRLLEKLGFTFNEVMADGNGERLNLFSLDLNNE